MREGLEFMGLCCWIVGIGGIGAWGSGESLGIGYGVEELVEVVGVTCVAVLVRMLYE